MKKLKSKRAQHLMEYAILFSLVAAALVGIRVFFSRAVQEKFRQSADVFGGGEQYSPGRTNTSGGGLQSGVSSGSASRSSGSGLSGSPRQDTGTGEEEETEDVPEETTERELSCEQANSTAASINTQSANVASSISQLEEQIPQMESNAESFRDQAFWANLFNVEVSGSEYDELAEQFDVDPVDENIIGQNVYRKADIYYAIADNLDAAAADCRTKITELNARQAQLNQERNSIYTDYPECF